MASRMYYESGVVFSNVSLTGELNMDWSSEVSFRKNLDQFFANNEVSENVQNLIWKSLEEKANAR